MKYAQARRGLAIISIGSLYFIGPDNCNAPPDCLDRASDLASCQTDSECS
jgi:hypothetical protein